MDKRREPRFEADQSVIVTLLRDPEVKMPATVQNYSGRGLGLTAPSPIAPGTALKIEIDDSMILGEAVYCRQQEEGSCYVGVELNQVLAGLAELGRCLQDLSASPSGGQAVHAFGNRDTENR